MRFFRLALPFAAFVFLVGCEPTSSGQCGPTNCSGCCDSSGTCQPGGFPQQCGAQGFACRACAGGQLCQLGQCSGGSSTGGGGGTCTPKSCMELSKNCGEVSDGCGGTLMCGQCEVQGESCGAGGVANVCAQGTCTATTCVAEGKTCGSISDGCAAQLNCGTCSGANQVCNSMNTCEAVQCTARTCQQLGKNCGMVSDGCTGQLNCGTCTVSGQSCGGGGTANVCGAGACTPKTCQQLNATCGMVNDTCGNMIPCGTCSAPQTCGGAGVPNSCGAMCVGTCPTGFTCMTGDGACAGGNLSNVALDVPVPPQHVVSGVVTRNGIAPPTGCYSGYDVVDIEFEHATDARFHQRVSIRCNNSATDWSWTASLYPGTYKVTVSPDSGVPSATLPSWSTVVRTAFAVSGPQTNVALDVPVPPQHIVSGVVTRNGVAPSTSCYSGYDVVDIEFEHATDTRFNQRVSIRCNNSVTDWSWTASLYPGTYKVTVSPDSGVPAASLPSWSTVVRTAFAVSGPQTNVALDIPVPPQHIVSGVVTRNGVAPSMGCYSGYDVVDIAFEHATDARFHQRVSIRCNNSATDWSWTASLYPGTYKVTVSPDSGVPAASLPSWSTVVRTAFAVSGPQTNVALDIPVPPQHIVSGVVTRNGIAPPMGCYSGYDVVDIEFEHSTDTRFNQRVSIRCNNSATDWSWTASLYPGTYKVTVSPDSGVPAASLPSWSTVVRTAFAVSGPQTNVALDIPVPPPHTVSGVVTRNGVAPSTACYSGYDVVDIEFEHATDARFHQRVSIRCNNSVTDWSWTTSLYPGTYKVTVSPDSGVPAASLPSWSTVVRTAFAVSGPQTNVALDVPVPPQHIVSGVVTRNGVALPTACYSGYDVVDIEFEHATDTRFDQRVSIRCTNSVTDWSWTASLYPGIYKVTVSPDSGAPSGSLPSWSTVVINALRVP